MTAKSLMSMLDRRVANRLPVLLALLTSVASLPLVAASYPCLVEPHVVVDLSTAVEGVLESVNVRKGDFVARGAVVARLESSVEQAMVEQAEARAGMQSTIRAREVSLARNSEKHERAVKLSSQKFVSPDELDELRSAVDLARLELEAERENQRLAEIELKRYRALLQQRELKSPIDGVVVQRYLNAGEFAQAQPILRIAQLDPLNVEAVLPGDVHGHVEPGMPARVLLHGDVERTIEAEITIVEQVIDAASGTFGVRVELANTDHAIPAGLECSLVLEAREHH
jgi:RND family efflux transporter MFP subunit